MNEQEKNKEDYVKIENDAKDIYKDIEDLVKEKYPNASVVSLELASTMFSCVNSSVISQSLGVNKAILVKQSCLTVAPKILKILADQKIQEETGKFMMPGGEA